MNREPAPYDEEGKEHVKTIAEYALKFVRDDEDPFMSHGINDIIRSSMKENDYLDAKYNPDRVEEMIYTEMRRMKKGVRR